MIQGRRGVDEDYSFNGVFVCKKGLGGAKSDDAAEGPAWCYFSWRALFGDGMK